MPEIILIRPSASRAKVRVPHLRPFSVTLVFLPFGAQRVGGNWITYVFYEQRITQSFVSLATRSLNRCHTTNSYLLHKNFARNGQTLIFLTTLISEVVEEDFPRETK